MGKKDRESISIAEIPADEVVEMTKTWHRAFSTAGCEPTCHGCGKDLLAGKFFKLATKKGHGEKKADFDLVRPRKRKFFFSCTCRERLRAPEKYERKNGVLGKCFKCGIVWEQRYEEPGGQQWWVNLPENNMMKNVEVMLCATCTREDVTRRKSIEAPTSYQMGEALGKGCFRVGGKIVLSLDT